MPYDHESSVAIAAVRAAAEVCRAVRRTLVRADTLAKKDRSPVTVADFASQAVICAALAEAFPADPIVAEEGSAELRAPDNAALRRSVTEHVGAVRRGAAESDVLAWIDRGGHAPGAGLGEGERFWTLDPIDGTKGFLRGEQYAVALALIERGRVVLGVLGCPSLTLRGVPADGPAPADAGVLLVAVGGEGTRLLPLAGTGAGGERIRVDGVRDPAAARFCESVESGHSDQGASAEIARALGITAPPVRMDSQAKYAAVARGDASIYLRLPTRADYREMIWDHAAGVLAVEEAGGRVTDVDGRPLDFARGRRLEANRGVVATNAAIHDAVLQAVSGTLSRREKAG